MPRPSTINDAQVILIDGKYYKNDVVTLPHVLARKIMTL